MEESRDWFETAEEVQERVAALKTTLKQNKANGKGGAGAGGPKKPQSKKQQLKAAKGL